MTASDHPLSDDLIGRLYDELRLMARAHLRREQTGHTLDTGALIHEAWLRLLGQQGLETADRSRFFAIASTTMRRILVDHARTRTRDKRGGGMATVPLEAADALLSVEDAEEMMALHEALDRLSGVDPRGSEIVQLRFFAGLSVEEIAELLGVSTKTVQRSWQTARAWLRKEVTGTLLGTQ